MSATSIVVIISGSLIGGSFRLVCYWLRLRFLREVFRHNGDREDLRIAGRATSTGRQIWAQDARGEPGAAAATAEETFPA